MPISSFLAPSAIAKPGVCTSSTRPASPYEGQVIYETDTDRTLVWNGSGWVFLSTSAAGDVGLVKIVPTGATNGTVGSDGAVTIGNAVSSVTVNGAFTSLYDNYRIVVSGGVASGAADTSLQLSGITTAVYQISGYYMTPGVATLNAYSPAASTSFLLGSINTVRYAHVLDLMSPFLSQQKLMVSMNGLSTSGVYSFSGHCTSTASATGFTIIANGGQTLTGGTIRIYGYRN